MTTYRAIQSTGASAAGRETYAKSDLFRAADLASAALGLSDAVAVTLNHMVRSIPKSAAAPICATAVHILAEERGVTNRTIYNHIQHLVRLGLAVDRCEGGGRRVVNRVDCDGGQRIAGIDLTPLVTRRAEFEAIYAEMEAEKAEKKRLRSRISSTRRAIKGVLRTLQSATPDLIAAFEGLPRRIADFTRAQLLALMEDVERLLERLHNVESDPEDIENSVNDSDQSERSVRRNTSTNVSNIHESNPRMRAEKKGSSDRGAPTCGLEHVTMAMAMAMAPEDWLIRMDRHGQRDWNGLSAVGYERAAEIGVSPTAWAVAQAQLGRSGAALLALLADVNSVERGGFVRKPGAWFRAMTDRVEAGTARLHASVFGVLARERSET